MKGRVADWVNIRCDVNLEDVLGVEGVMNGLGWVWDVNGILFMWMGRINGRICLYICFCTPNISSYRHDRHRREGVALISGFTYLVSAT